ncbi:hypothetical protein C2G38_2185804 [Gigaspora rosea]|uniref:Uncharacterized protein n=1 Tax=Gigaspora rosea TaxID=44941 RepID=A0A397VF93_9GLOM|nr:hypothetical protein C2G38_2185804 [Gigaspora rosea]
MQLFQKNVQLTISIRQENPLLDYTIIADLRNKFVNQHKLEVGLYLMVSGAIWEAVDTISSLGYSLCAKTVDTYRKKIRSEHSAKIIKYFLKHVIMQIFIDIK